MGGLKLGVLEKSGFGEIGFRRNQVLNQRILSVFLRRFKKAGMMGTW